MSSSNISHETWIGKLVWFFPRDDVGLPIGNSAICGIVIDKSTDGQFIILYKGERLYASVADMEIVEEW